MTNAKRLVYLVLEVSTISAWREYLLLMYGLELRPSHNPNEYEVVIDDSGCRIIFLKGKANDCVAAGWEVEDLDSCSEYLSNKNYQLEWLKENKAKSRGISRGLKLYDSSTGIDIELFENTFSANSFVLPKNEIEFEAGDLGFGHMTFNVKNLDDFDYFYKDALGLKATDYNQPIIGPGVKINVAFLRANKRHHSVAAAQINGKRLNHFQLETTKRNNVGLSYDRVRKSKFTIAHHVGVHPNDNQISFYAVTPSGFQSEIGAESKYVPENYEPIMFRGFSVWGHSMSYKVRFKTFLSNSKLFFRKFFGLKDLPDPKCFDNLNNGINS